jgi:hypothetical protein
VATFRINPSREMFRLSEYYYFRTENEQRKFKLIGHSYYLRVDNLQRMEAEVVGVINGAAVILGNAESTFCEHFTHKLSVFYVLGAGADIIVGIWDIGIQNSIIYQSVSSLDLMFGQALGVVALKALKAVHKPEYGEDFTWVQFMENRNWLQEFLEAIQAIALKMGVSVEQVNVLEIYKRKSA